MIIDFHTHVFPEKIAKSTIETLALRSNGKPSTDGTVKGLVDAMDRSDCDICVTFPVLTKATQFDSVTRFVTSINQEYSQGKRKIISFAGMHPDCENVSEKIAYIKSLGIKGIKIHPDYQSTYIDDERYVNIIKEAKKHDLIVITHSGVDDGYMGEPVRCTPERVLKVINEVDHDKFVLAHYGAHKMWDETLEILAGKNVYFDTAFTLHEISKERFIQILDKHGADKVLFATDCPWREIKEDVAILKSFMLNKKIEDKILYKNAVKLLGI